MRNEQVIKAFLMEREGKAASLVSDGKRIYSYGVTIGLPIWQVDALLSTTHLLVDITSLRSYQPM